MRAAAVLAAAVVVAVAMLPAVLLEVLPTVPRAVIRPLPPMRGPCPPATPTQTWTWIYDAT